MAPLGMNSSWRLMTKRQSRMRIELAEKFRSSLPDVTTCERERESLASISENV